MDRSSEEHWALALDVGGTKILGGLINRDGVAKFVYRESLVHDGPDAVLSQMARIANHLRRDKHPGAIVDGIGVAVPGAVREDGTVWAPNIAGWEQVHLATILSDSTGLPVAVEDDRVTSMLAEWKFGAAQHVRTAAFVTIGTGIGVGLLVDGKIWKGVHGVAGSIGWWASGTRLLRPVEVQVGMLEAAVAGPRITRLMKRARISPPTARELVVAARRGNQRALKIMRHVGDIVGVAIANVVSLIDPDVVIVGGGIAQAGPLLLDPVRVAVQRYAQPLARSVPIRSSTLGTRASLMGAAVAVCYPSLLNRKTQGG